jgi:hypothetical protein
MSVYTDNIRDEIISIGKITDTKILSVIPLVFADFLVVIVVFFYYCKEGRRCKEERYG